MSIRIIEIKAKCRNADRIREVLRTRNAVSKGTDRQVDTYFAGASGRLKLRRGTIENTLIGYQRENTAAPKLSQVKLYKPDNPDDLYLVLSASLNVLLEVTKTREIYFIENIKIHIDQVEGLGSFVEIEAIDEYGTRTVEELHEQCAELMQAFSVTERDLETHSYSDLLMM